MDNINRTRDRFGENFDKEGKRFISFRVFNVWANILRLKLFNIGKVKKSSVSSLEFTVEFTDI